MAKNNVRIIDIAESIGVSTATVSNVLHGKTKKISDETVRMVQKALEEEEYIPSQAKILLAQNNSKIIGIVMNNHPKYEGHLFEDPFVSSAMNALSFEIEKNGYFMMVKAIDEKDIHGLSKFASMWNLEGLVLMGFCEQDYKRLRDHIRIPFVIYDGYFTDKNELVEYKIGNICIDNFSGGLQIGKHYRELGYAKAICISDNDCCVDAERMNGFWKGFCNKEPCASEKIIVPIKKDERINFYNSMLQRFKDTHVVFCVSDFYAIELMQFLQGKGIVVPKDIRIAGFDDSPVCKMVNPKLTTVSQNQSGRAKVALQTLFSIKNGTEEGVEKTIPVNLVARES